ncbi:MAG: outer membrane protein assembly factor BamB [Methylococcus sp.]|nr:MAG: outer membrane protein assembly factor BamB [Methylococcus sp.]
MALRLFGFLLVILVSGCEVMQSISDSTGGILDPFIEIDNSEPPSELTDYEAELELEILWQVRIGAGSDGMYSRLVPVNVDEMIVVADRDGLVQARNRNDGELIWETETEKPISAGPGVSSRMVLFGTSDAEVLALNVDNGSLLWEQSVSSEVLAAPTARGGIVVIRTVDGRLIGLEESTGTLIWTYERGVPPLSLRGTANPVIEGNQVIEGYASGKLVALRLTDGRVEWENRVVIAEGRSELERLVDLDSDPLIIDESIYLASFQGGVFALSLLDGQMIWRRREMSVYSNLIADWSYLYLSDESSDVWALEQRNGASLWKQADLHRRQLSSPAIYKSSIVVGDFEGYLHWLSQYDGRQMGRIRISDSSILVQPLVVDDVLYAYSQDGILAAVVSD